VESLHVGKLLGGGHADYVQVGALDLLDLAGSAAEEADEDLLGFENAGKERKREREKRYRERRGEERREEESGEEERVRR